MLSFRFIVAYNEKNNKNIRCETVTNQLVNTYSKNKQKSHLKIRISVNGFFK